MQNGQSAVSDPMNTTCKFTEKNAPSITENITTRITDIGRLEPNLINPTPKV